MPLLRALLLLLGRSRDLGSPNHPMHCWDAGYVQRAASGRYEHAYCVDERGEVFRDDRRILRRWDGARVEWKVVN